MNFDSSSFGGDKRGQEQLGLFDVSNEFEPIIYNQVRQKRTPYVIAQFVDGYAVGWRMAVPEAFREALDIKLTQRVITKTVEVNGEKKKKKIIRSEWTQGRGFSFKEADTLYDSRVAYDKKWCEALKQFRMCIKVIKAFPAGFIDKSYVETLTERLPISISNNGEETEKKDVEKLQISFQTYNPGYIKFKVYRPDTEKVCLNGECDTYECTQEAFVSFLQTGLLWTNDKEIVHLLHEHAKQPKSEV